MNTEIKDGFTKLEDWQPLDVLIDALKYLAASADSERDAEYAKRELKNYYQSIAAPVASEGGFEKKTEFGGTQLCDIKDGNFFPANPFSKTERQLASHVRECHAEIDRQAAELAQFKQKLEWAEKLFSNDPEAFHIMRANISRTWSMDNQKALAKWILGMEYSGMVAELAQLKAAREWQPVTVEALEAAPDGTYEFIRNGGELGVKLKAGADFNWGNVLVANACSHFRLITRAEDFTPPERKIKIGDAEYSRDELARVLGALGLKVEEGE